MRIMNNNFNYNIIAKQDLTKMPTCFKNMTAFNHQFMSDFEWMYNSDTSCAMIPFILKKLWHKTS